MKLRFIIIMIMIIQIAVVGIKFCIPVQYMTQIKSEKWRRIVIMMIRLLVGNKPNIPFRIMALRTN